MYLSNSKPTCLVFAGHDPSGGAGVQADIEALASVSCHAVTVLTGLTVQDTSNVYAVTPAEVTALIEQARAVLADIPIQAIKIGMVPSAEVAEAIHTLLRDYFDVPVILDPVVRAGGGGQLQDEETQAALRTLLFPLTTVLTPNSPEARQFAAGADTLDACGMALLETGCEYVLITGGHESGDQVCNRLYGNNRCLETFNWPRLSGEYHGSGCTLSSSIAGLLAHGKEPLTAVRHAQQFTWDSLNHATRIGQGQLKPNRFYWAESKD